MTAARVLKQEGRLLHLDRLDFLDQTPVIDIKPYFVTRDMLFCANGRQIGRPRQREDLRESLLIQAVHFHGELTPEVALGVRILEHYRVVIQDWQEPEEIWVTVPFERPQLADALMGMTRATPGRGTLRFHALHTVVIAPGIEYTLSARLPAIAARSWTSPTKRSSPCAGRLKAGTLAA